MKKIYYKLSRPDLMGDYCVFEDFDSIFFEVDAAEVGDKFEIEIVELTQEEVDDLGEFEGW